MKNFIKKSKLAATFPALAFVFAMGTTQAAIFQIDFSNSGAFSGSAPSLPANPDSVYAKAIFDDHGGAGTVTLTMTVLNNLLPSGAYTNDWYFNVVDSAHLTKDSITFVDGTKTNQNNFFKLTGQGKEFDLAFHFKNAHPGELAQGHSSVYELTGAGLTANSFNFLSYPHAANGDGYLSVMHLQGYGNSVWVGGTPGIIQLPLDPASVPEPETIALIGLGLLGIALIRRRRQISF